MNSRVIIPKKHRTSLRCFNLQIRECVNVKFIFMSTQKEKDLEF